MAEEMRDDVMDQIQVTNYNYSLNKLLLGTSKQNNFNLLIIETYCFVLQAELHSDNTATTRDPWRS